MELRLSLPGRPYCKKNNPRAFCISGCRGWSRGQGSQPKKLLLPSKEYEDYEKMALEHLLQYGNIQFDKKVHVTAEYWMPDHRSRPDLVGLLQATGDILEKAGIIKNDRLVISWDGSIIMGISKTNPRADILIKEVE